MTSVSSPDLKFPWGLQMQTCFQMYGTKRKFHHSEAEMPTQSSAKRLCFVPSPLEPSEHEQRYPHSNPELPTHHDNLPNDTQLGKRLMGCEDDSGMAMTSKRTRNAAHQDNESEMCDDDDGISNVHMQATNRQQSLTKERDWQHSNECSDFQHQLVGHEGEQQQMLECKRLHEQAAAEHAEKLQNQIDFLQEIQSQSNDYWAIPQENQLKMADELEQARMAMDSDFVPDPYQYGCMPAGNAVPMAGPNAHTTVGQVRCYCKPNWEGMLEPMSYI